jgi:hypothetical protein
MRNRLGQLPDGADLALYCGRVAVGLILAGVLAVTLHAYVAAEVIVAAVIVAVVAMGSALVTREAEL